MTKVNNACTKEEIFARRIRELNAAQMAQRTSNTTGGGDMDFDTSEAPPKVFYGRLTSVEKNNFTLRNGKHQYLITINKGTFFTEDKDKVYKLGTKLAVIKKGGKAVFVSSKAFLEEHLVPYPEAEPLILFWSCLPRDDQEIILLRLNYCRIYDCVVNPQILLEKNGIRAGINDKIEDNLATYACLVLRTLAPVAQKSVARLISRDAAGRSSFGMTETKEKRRAALEALLLSPIQKELKMSEEEIISELDNLIFGRAEQKKRIAEIIVSCWRKKKKACILLTGPDSCGKKHFTKAVAKVLSYPFCRIPMAGASSVDLAGDSSVYQGADFGDFIKKCIENETSQGVFSFSDSDRIDPEHKEGDAAGPICEAADEESPGWYDRFSASYHNIDFAVLFATAKRREKVSAEIRENFTEISLEPYSDAEKVGVVKFKMKEFLDEEGIAQDATCFEEGVLYYIATRYTSDSGFRQMQDHVRLLLKRFAPLYKKDKRLTITKKMVDEWLCVNEEDRHFIFKRNSYETHIAEDINENFSISEDEDLKMEERKKAERRLDILLGLKEPSSSVFFSKEAFLKCLSERYICRDGIKKWLADHLYALSLKNKTMGGLKILLIGPPGTGKTEIAGSLASGLQKELVKISMNGCSDVDALLKGSLKLYDNAGAGKIIEYISKIGTKDVVLLFDEIEKGRRHNGENGCDALLDLFDDGKLTDHYIGYPVDLSAAIVICTANTYDTLSDAFINRFDLVLNMDGYTRGEKKQIIEKSALKKIGCRYCDELQINILPEALELLLAHTSEPGVRELIHATDEAVVRKINSKYDNKLLITSEDVVDALGNPPSKKCEERICAGYAYALAVDNHRRGLVFPVETVKVPESGLKITGLPMEATSESVMVAKTISQKRLPDVCQKELESGLHVHFSNAGIPKNGPSAGLAVVISMLSCILDKPIKKRAAFTGEIGPNGYVGKIGCLYEKALAAQDAGLDTVYAPQGNIAELSEEQLEDLKKITLVPVVHVKDAMDVF